MRKAFSASQRRWRDDASLLTRRFLVRSGLAFVVIGVVVHVLVGRQVSARYESFAEFHAEFVATSLVQPELEREGVLTGPVSDGTRSRLTAFVDDFVIVGDVLRLKVWLPDGTIVLSDDAALIGRRSPELADHLTRVVREGTHTEREHASDGDDVGAVPYAIESYVPIAVGGTSVVVEVYQDLDPTLRAARDFTRTLDVILVIGLAGLWVLLIPIVRRAARRVQRQNVELERLLTGEKETVRRLEELNDMKDTFLTAVSHELRTPLTALKAGVQALRRHGRALDAGTRDKLVERVHVSAGRLEELLSSLLDLDRLTRGTVEPIRQTTDLRSLVLRVLDTIRPLRPVGCEVPSVAVEVDPGQVERIVENLVVNALRHTPADRTVLIAADVGEDRVVLRVDDDGPGVPDGLKLSIFEPFVQGPSLHPESPGTGVGLALVQRFSELNGGRVWVEDGPSGGASFRVSFPVSPPNHQPDLDPEARPGDGRPVGAATSRS